MTNPDDKNDPDTEVFLQALEDVRGDIQNLKGWDACLALVICLAECITLGNSEDDEYDETLRLAQAINAPSPDLLRKLLEKRRAGSKP